MSTDPRLSAELMFDEVDLAWNRAGSLSPDQRAGFSVAADVQRHRRPIALVIVLVGVCAAAASAVAASSAPGRAGVDRSQLAIALIALGAAALVIVTVAVLLGRRGERFAAATTAPDARVLAVTGVATLHRRTSGESGLVSYDLRLGDVRFRMDSIRAAAFDEGATYRVYYLPEGWAGPMMLTVERL
jgi:hypothetical protein